MTDTNAALAYLQKCNSNDEKIDMNTTELEAAAFRHLVQHLQQRQDVQNIELMNLAGFCRNCLAKWYKAAAEERNEDISYEQARELIYGMPYEQWKSQHQTPATEAQLNQFDINKPKD